MALIRRKLSIFYGICYLPLEILVFSFPFENRSESLFSSLYAKNQQSNQKIIDDEANLDDGYLCV